MQRLFRTLLAMLAGAVVAVALLPTGAAQAIRGGVDVDVADYPWAVVITRPGSPHPQKESCGGVLLAANVIATAGHCTGTGTGWSDRTVIAGRTDLTTTAGKTAKPVSVYLHPEFASCQNGLKCGDLAIWFLDNNIGTSFVTPSGNANDDATGAVATMVSWGNVGSGQYTSHSKKGEFTRAADKTCTDAGFTFTAGKVACYGPVSGQYGTCSGDSGSGYIVGGNKWVGAHSGGDSNCNGPQLAMRVFNDFAAIGKIVACEGGTTNWTHTGSADPNCNVNPGDPSVTNPGNRSGQVNQAASLQLNASGGTTPYSWSATGLPSGLSISSSSGLISGTPNSVGVSNVTVTVTDAANKTASTSFSWTISDTPPPGEGVVNGGFESGLSGWTTSGAVSVVNTPVHGGASAARLGAGTLTQTFTAKSSQLSLWYRAVCSAWGFGQLTITLRDNVSGSTSTLATKFCGGTAYQQASAGLTTGRSYTLTATASDSSFSGSFAAWVIDDVSSPSAGQQHIL